MVMIFTEDYFDLGDLACKLAHRIKSPVTRKSIPRSQLQLAPELNVHILECSEMLCTKTSQIVMAGFKKCQGEKKCMLRKSLWYIGVKPPIYRECLTRIGVMPLSCSVLVLR